MGADEVAVIRPALLELEAALAKPAPDAGPLCASFEVEPRGTPWLQVVLGEPDTFNVCYPFRGDRSPLDWIRQLRSSSPPDLQLTAHEPGAYATFSFSRPSPVDLARFIDAVLGGLLGPTEKYPLTVKFFHLPK